MKKRAINRIITLLLAVSLPPGLTACGKEETDGQDGRTFYVPQAVDFSTGLQSIDGCCLIGENLYLSGHADKNKSGPCEDKEGAWAFLRTLLLPHGEGEISEPRVPVYQRKQVRRAV